MNSLDLIADRSDLGVSSWEELAWVRAQAPKNASLATLGGLLGLSGGDVARLETDRVFRNRVREIVALSVLSVDKERQLYEGLLASALDGSEKGGTRVAVARSVLQQAGVLEADRKHVEHGGGIDIRFKLDQPEDDSYSAPDPFRGVVGHETAGALPGSGAKD